MDLARITAFSDGVMAVAITLLVLNIDVPRVPADQLPAELDNLLTPLAAYARGIVNPNTLPVPSAGSSSHSSPPWRSTSERAT